MLGEFIFPKGICPNAENFQPKIMRFKTNYRDIDKATEKISILKKTLLEVSKK